MWWELLLQLVIPILVMETRVIIYKQGGSVFLILYLKKQKLKEAVMTCLMFQGT